MRRNNNRLKKYNDRDIFNFKNDDIETTEVLSHATGIYNFMMTNHTGGYKMYIEIAMNRLNESSLYNYIKNPFKNNYISTITYYTGQDEYKKIKSHARDFNNKLQVYKETYFRYLMTRREKFENAKLTAYDNHYNPDFEKFHEVITILLKDGFTELTSEKRDEFEKIKMKILPFQLNENIFMKKINTRVAGDNVWAIMYPLTTQGRSPNSELRGKVDKNMNSDDKRIFNNIIEETINKKKKKSLVEFLPEQEYDDNYKTVKDKNEIGRGILDKFDEYTRQTNNIPLIHIEYTGLFFRYNESKKYETYEDMFYYYSLRDITNWRMIEEIREYFSKELGKYYFGLDMNNELFNNFMFHFQYPKTSPFCTYRVKWINPIQVLHEKQYKLDNMYLFDDVINNLKQDNTYYKNDITKMMYKSMKNPRSPEWIYTLIQDFKYELILFLTIFKSITQKPGWKGKDYSKLYQNGNPDTIQDIKDVILTFQKDTTKDFLNPPTHNNRRNIKQHMNGGFIPKYICGKNNENIQLEKDILDGIARKQKITHLFGAFKPFFDKSLEEQMNAIEDPQIKCNFLVRNTQNILYNFAVLQEYFLNDLPPDLIIILKFFMDFDYWEDKMNTIFNHNLKMPRNQLSLDVHPATTKAQFASLPRIKKMIGEINLKIGELNHRDNFIQIKSFAKQSQESKNNNGFVIVKSKNRRNRNKIDSTNMPNDDKKMFDGIEKYKIDTMTLFNKVNQLLFRQAIFDELKHNALASQNYVLWRSLKEELEKLDDYITYSNFKFDERKVNRRTRVNINILTPKLQEQFRRVFNIGLQFRHQSKIPIGDIIMNKLFFENPPNKKKVEYILTLFLELDRIGYLEKSPQYLEIQSFINLEILNLRDFRYRYMSKNHFGETIVIGYYNDYNKNGIYYEEPRRNNGRNNNNSLDKIVCVKFRPKKNNINSVDFVKMMTFRKLDQVVIKDNPEEYKNGNAIRCFYNVELDFQGLLYYTTIYSANDGEEGEGYKMFKRHVKYDVYRMKLQPEKLDKFTNIQTNFNAMQTFINNNGTLTKYTNIFPSLQTYAIFIVKFILKNDKNIFKLYQNELEDNFMTKLSFSNYFVSFFPDINMTNFESINPFDYISNLKKQGKKWDNNVFLNYIHIITWFIDKKFEFIYDNIWKYPIKDQSGIRWMNKQVYDRLKETEIVRGETTLLNEFTYFNIKGHNEKGVYGIVEVLGEKDGIIQEVKDTIYLNCNSSPECPSKILKNPNTLFYTPSLSRNNIYNLLKLMTHGVMFLNNKILNTLELKKKYSIQLQLKITPHIHPTLTNSILHIHFYFLQTPYMDLSLSETFNKALKNTMDVSKITQNLILKSNIGHIKFIDRYIYSLLTI